MWFSRHQISGCTTFFLFPPCSEIKGAAGQLWASCSHEFRKNREWFQVLRLEAMLWGEPWHPTHCWLWPFPRHTRTFCCDKHTLLMALCRRVSSHDCELLHLTELKGQINVCDRAKGPTDRPCHWSIMCVHVSERVLEMMCFYALLLSSELLQSNRLLINSDFWHTEITVRVIGHQQKNVRCNCGFYKNCSFSAWTGHMRLNKDIKQDTYVISYLLFLTCSLKVGCKVFLYCHFHLKFILKRSSWLLVSWTKAACITWAHEHYVSNKFSHLY